MTEAGAALLPSLDPTTMGWTQRDWYLGPHRPRSSIAPATPDQPCGGTGASWAAGHSARAARSSGGCSRTSAPRALGQLSGKSSAGAAWLAGTAWSRRLPTPLYEELREERGSDRRCTRCGRGPAHTGRESDGARARGAIRCPASSGRRTRAIGSPYRRSRSRAPPRRRSRDGNPRERHVAEVPVGCDVDDLVATGGPAAPEHANGAWALAVGSPSRSSSKDSIGDHRGQVLPSASNGKTMSGVACE